MYFDASDYFGEDYFTGHFDASPAVVHTSGSPGISKSFPLGTVAPRPPLPPWRQVKGPAGLFLTDVRNSLQDVYARDHLWGNHVDVEFTVANTPTRIATGLGGPAKGYKIVRASADVRVWDATPSAPSEERGVLWLQASAPAKVTLYIY